MRKPCWTGDGPHYGPRNSSFALAEFRPHGLAGVGAPQGWIHPVAGRTLALLVTGNQLVVSADADIPLFEAVSSYTNAGYGVPKSQVTLTPVGVTGVSCIVTGSNVTEHPIDQCDLTSLIGSKVAFDIEVTGGALLYTIDFVNKSA